MDEQDGVAVYSKRLHRGDFSTSASSIPAREDYEESSMGNRVEVARALGCIVHAWWQ